MECGTGTQHITGHIFCCTTGCVDKLLLLLGNSRTNQQNNEESRTAGGGEEGGTNIHALIRVVKDDFHASGQY